jgi:hypothetical protein
MTRFALAHSTMLGHPRATEKHRFPMIQTVATDCPYCGEPVQLDIDEDGGSHQAYVEDCPVCCQPWEVEIAQLADGDWTATLRTTDE